MIKLIITKGLPASGKTTFAKEMVNKHGYKRINRDDLRAMIDNGKWSKDNEDVIKLAEEELAKLYILMGYDIIIDNTHLDQKTINRWVDFAASFSVKSEIKDFTHVPVDECIKRDQKRPNYVGEKVIRKMYHQHLSKPPANIPEVIKRTLPEAWISDIDGSLALFHGTRSPYETHLCENDVVNESLRIILNNIKQPRNIFLMSGRYEKYRDITERWLKSNEIEYTTLFMRSDDDNRNDAVVKEELYMKNIHNKYHVIGWFDDRLRVCRMIHNLGIPLYRIGDPEADF